MKIFSLLLCLVIISAPGFVHADFLAPDVLINAVVHDVLEVSNQDKRAQETGQKNMLAVIDAKVVPYFDFERMTKLAVGKAWRAATPEQKKLLIAEFRTLVVRTYAKAFSLYSNSTVETKPVVIPANTDELTIKTVILRPGAPPILVSYEMEKTDTGWKAFDVLVEGISLVATHRNSFAEKVQQSGIDGLIKSLAELNGKPEAVSVNRAVAK